MDDITLGYIPLLDSCVLIVTAARGFAQAEGVGLTLVREISWANIRDRVSVGHFDGAHMLAPMPIAFNLGLAPLSVDVVAPMALGLGGNAVTVSRALHREMSDHGAIDIRRPATGGLALRAAIDTRRSEDRKKPVFAVVHFHSAHHYELRYWLSGCGIDPDREVEIVVIPPSLMPDALATGTIDGYCAGEPWNTAAVRRGVGNIVTVKSAIWRSSPEKVLGLSQKLVDSRPETVERLIRATYAAARWCADPQNRDELLSILESPEWLGLDRALLLPAVSGAIDPGDGHPVQVDDFFLPYQKAATFPWQSHALWFYSQMVRWGHATDSDESRIKARDSYRPDLYRRALAPLGQPVPAANMKVEGAMTGPTLIGASSTGLLLGPDGFFDGKIFDPEQIGTYLRG